MIRVEIQSSAVQEKGGVVRSGARQGESYHIRQQEAWLHNGRAYPERFVLNLGPEKAPYPVGTYQLAPESLQIGEYSRLEVARDLVLLREAEQPKLSAAK